MPDQDDPTPPGDRPSTTELDRQAMAAARAAVAVGAPPSTGEMDAIKAEVAAPLPDSVQRSYLGQAALLINRITGIPTRAVMILLVVAGGWFYYQHGHFPSVDLAKAEARQTATAAVEADKAFEHEKMNSLAGDLIGLKDQLTDQQDTIANLRGQVAHLRGLHGISASRVMTLPPPVVVE